MGKDETKSEADGKREGQQLQPPKPPPTRLVFGEEKKKDKSEKD